MALRIAHNIAAMNTHRWLSAADEAMAKNLNRLSSGYRINSGADDAAGLAVSQQFRADIASFRVASRNASEANALLQVADGALDQIGNILTRLKELATQASSANVSSTNRAKLNAEFNKLVLEANRIANSTQYAGNKLIDGTYGVAASTWSSQGTTGRSVVGLKVDETYSITVSDNGSTWSVTVTTGVGSEKKMNITDPSGDGTVDVYFQLHGITITFDASMAAGTGHITAASSGSSVFRVGSTENSEDEIALSLDDTTTGSSGLNIANLDISTVSGAETAMTSINTAISTLTSRRGAVGAYMNRLSYAAANLATVIENSQAAESVIRDVDMAAEMTEFTKNQILTQAGTAMLAQANLSAQTILTLFR